MTVCIPFFRWYLNHAKHSILTAVSIFVDEMRWCYIRPMLKGTDEVRKITLREKKILNILVSLSGFDISSSYGIFSRCVVGEGTDVKRQNQDARK